jgi:hypothetical protein
MFSAVVLPILIGMAFGWSLHKAGMTRYHKIVNVFRLTDLAVLKFMMSAMVVGVGLIYTFQWLGWITLAINTPVYVVGNFGGGLLFGIGMAAAGFCPGTVVAGSGQGSLDYLIPGMLGFFTGALLFGLIYPVVMPAVTSTANYGSASFPELFNLSPGLTAIVFMQMIVIVMYVLEKKKVVRKDKLAEAE